MSVVCFLIFIYVLRRAFRATESGEAKVCSEIESDATCDTIHIGLVCAGYNSSRIVATLIKSILFHRQHPIHFHFMVDSKANVILRHLFETWKLPEVNVTFYHADQYIQLIEWIPNKHYSGVFGLLKLLFPHILSTSVPKIITLDTDVTFLADVYELWKKFKEFLHDQSIGVVENQSDWYFGKLWMNYKPWPAIGRGFNTGVMLLDIQKLNANNWAKLWRSTAAEYLGTFGSTSLADQDIINAVLKNNPEYLFHLPCHWNVQLSDNTLSESCYKNIKDVKVIHWNSPRKLRVKNNDSAVFRVLYQTYLEYNGNFLRAPMFHCNNTTMTKEITYSGDRCLDFHRAQNISWRTHLFIIDYKYEINSDENDITLVTQLSIDRLQMVEEICKHWEGPISFTFYINDAEVQHVWDYVANSAQIQERTNIAYHIVYKEGDVYPVNYLRNVGLKNAQTPFVFLTDIDFLPMHGLYNYAKKYVTELALQYNKKALLIPAFETQRYRITFPRSKAQLLSMLDHGTLLTFRYHVWSKGHEPTNYTKWRTALYPYKVKWKPDFEPYIIVHKSVPQYDTRFVGFGWNKVSHIMEMNAQGYEFIVLLDAFMIHLPHAPSYDIARFRSSQHYRICLKILKDQFVRELNSKYSSTLTTIN